MNTNVVGRSVSDANHANYRDHEEHRGFRQNEHNVQNRGNGIFEIAGKGAMGSAEQGGSRASFNRFCCILLILSGLCVLCGE